MSTPKANGPHSEQGLALVLVLWAVALLAVLAASQLVDARSGIALVRNQVAAAQARALADAGINRGILELTKGRARALWPGPESVVQWAFGQGVVRIRVENEFGKLDLNSCAPSLLKRLITGIGVQSDTADHLVDAIEDFRDSDNLKRLNGAEKAEYAAVGLPYGPKNEPFASVEELQQVIGLSPTLYTRLAPYLTVYTGRAYVDMGVASRDLVALLTEQHQGNGRQPSAAPAAPFGGAQLTGGAGLPFSGAGLGVYTVYAEARVGTLTKGEHATVLISPSAQAYTVVAWREAKEHLFGPGG